MEFRLKYYHVYTCMCMHIFVTWKKKTKADQVRENRKGTKRVTGEGKIKEQVFSQIQNLDLHTHGHS